MRLMSALISATMFLTAPASAAELLTNGNFETGNLSGWTVLDQLGSDGSWFASGNGTPSPIQGLATPTLAGGGNFNAQTDQGGPGSHQLTQTFNAAAGGTYILSFDAYASDQSGLAPVGDGLDFSTPALNQHIEILLTGAASPIFSGTFGPDWSHHVFDISPLITSTGPYTLSFAEVDNVFFYNFGLDNVSLASAQSAAVPEPTTWALMLAGFGVVAFAMRRTRQSLVKYRVA